MALSCSKRAANFLLEEALCSSLLWWAVCTPLKNWALHKNSTLLLFSNCSWIGKLAHFQFVENFANYSPIKVSTALVLRDSLRQMSKLTKISWDVWCQQCYQERHKKKAKERLNPRYLHFGITFIILSFAQFKWPYPAQNVRRIFF